MTKIPVKETIVEAYRYTFGHIGKIIAMIWLPQILLTVGGYYALKPYLLFAAGNPDGAEVLQNGPMLLTLYAYFFAAVILSAWIWSIIVKELLAPTKSVSYMAFLHPGPLHRVIGAFFAILGLFLVSAIILGLIGATLSGLHSSLAEMALIVVWCAVVFYFGLRLGYQITPVALAEGKLGLARSWQLTAGNFWRIAAIALATLLPLGLISEIGQIAIMGPGHFAQMFGNFDPAPDTAQRQLDNLRIVADRLPLLMGLNFFLAPFQCGLLLMPIVRFYKTQTAKPAAGEPPVPDHQAQD